MRREIEEGGSNHNNGETYSPLEWEAIGKLVDLKNGEPFEFPTEVASSAGTSASFFPSATKQRKSPCEEHRNAHRWCPPTCPGKTSS